MQQLTPCRGKEGECISWLFKGFSYNPDAFTQADIDEYVSKYSAPNAMRAGISILWSFPADVDQNRELAKER